MSSLKGIYWYVMLSQGPACIREIHNDSYLVTDLKGNYTIGDPTFLSPIFKSLTEFKLAYPEYFI